MSQENKTLDNTKISNQDIKELEKGEDNKLDNTSSTSTTNKKSTSTTTKSKNKSNKSKSQKDNSYNDASDKALGVQAQKPIDAGNPQEISLENIQNALTDPTIKKDFLNNVADLLGQYQRRKLTDGEVKTLENTVEDGLLTKVFKLKKTL